MDSDRSQEFTSKILDRARAAYSDIATSYIVGGRINRPLADLKAGFDEIWRRLKDNGKITRRSLEKLTGLCNSYEKLRMPLDGNEQERYKKASLDMLPVLQHIIKIAEGYSINYLTSAQRVSVSASKRKLGLVIDAIQQGCYPPNCVSTAKCLVNKLLTFHEETHCTNSEAKEGLEKTLTLLTQYEKRHCDDN